MPLVTVAIPCHNEAKTIERAVLSCRRQTVRDLQIILSDNASTDETGPIMAALAASDSRIRLLRTLTKTNITPNFQACFDAADSKYVIILPGHHILLPWALDVLVPVMEESATSTYAFGSVIWRDVTGRMSHRVPMRRPPFFAHVCDLQSRLIVSQEPIATIFSLKRIREAGGLDMRLERTNMWDLSARLCLYGRPALVPVPVACWSDAPFSLAKMKTAAREMPTLLSNFDSYLSRAGLSEEVSHRIREYHAYNLLKAINRHPEMQDLAPLLTELHPQAGETWAFRLRGSLLPRLLDRCLAHTGLLGLLKDSVRTIAAGRSLWRSEKCQDAFSEVLSLMASSRNQSPGDLSSHSASLS
jgi:hypothetical protein